MSKRKFLDPDEFRIGRKTASFKVFAIEEA
jgi:hypothetical protein